MWFADFKRYAGILVEDLNGYKACEDFNACHEVLACDYPRLERLRLVKNGNAWTRVVESTLMNK